MKRTIPYDVIYRRSETVSQRPVIMVGWLVKLADTSVICIKCLDAFFGIAFDVLAF